MDGRIEEECEKRNNNTEEYSEAIYEEVLEAFGLQKFDVTYELLHKTIPWNNRTIPKLLKLFEKQI